MKVIKNENIGENIFLLTISAKDIAKNALPGQFVNIKVSNSFYPFLRRPFSIHSVKGIDFEIIYKVVGYGTKLLSKYKEGDEIDILGPLGNSFNYEDYNNILLIAGGIGIAPLYFLYEKIKSKDVIFVIGAKNDKFPIKIYEEKIGKYSELLISTEDGSYGKKGLATQLLNFIPQPDAIFACGPIGMLKIIQNYAKKNNIKAFASLETHIVCGMGICFGCVIKTTSGYKYVCKDGPVFNLSEIIL